MAAGGDPNNISLGAGRLYVAPIGTAEPTNASTVLPSAWRPVGYTEEGTTVQIGVTNEEIEVAEEYEPVRYVGTKRTTRLMVALAEMTRRNLALVLAGTADAPNTAATLEPPVPGAETAFMVVWDSDELASSGTNVRWLFRSCKIAGNVDIARKKAPAKATMPVEIQVQKPASATSFKVFPNATGNV